MVKLFSSGGQFPDFAERQQLAEDKTHFCIEEVKLHTQKDGKVRWYCTIYVPIAGNLEVRTLTFDRSPARDQAFQSALDEGKLPFHNCLLDKRKFTTKGGQAQTFYDLDIGVDPKSCPCGASGVQKDEQATTPAVDEPVSTEGVPEEPDWLKERFDEAS